MSFPYPNRPVPRVDAHHIWAGYGFLPTRVKGGSSPGGTTTVGGGPSGQTIEVNIPGVLNELSPSALASVALTTGEVLSLSATGFEWALADASMALFADAFASQNAAMGASEVGWNLWGLTFTPKVLSSAALVAGPVYLSTAGQVTQTRPTTGYLQIVGKAVSSTTMLWQPQVWIRLT